MAERTADEIREWIDAVWERADREGDWYKDSMYSTNTVEREIGRLDATARDLATDILVEWIEGDDGRRRYTAFVLARKLGLKTALPALRRHAEALKTATGPSAPYDRENVASLIADLEAD